MTSNEPKAKVASITVLVDDSPVIMIFSDIHAALKLKRRLKEAFPDTVFTKSIEDEMLEKQAKKVAGLIIQRRLFISPTLSDEDQRIELQGKLNNGGFSRKVVTPVAVGAPWPTTYESTLTERIKEAEKHFEKVSNISQSQAAGVDMRSKVVCSAPSGSANFSKSDQSQAQSQQQAQQLQQQVFTRRPDSYIGQFLTAANLAPAAAGASQVQGDIPVHAASIIPISIHNGVPTSLTNANIFGPNAVNSGPNIITLGNVPVAQGSAGNIANPTPVTSGQGPQIRVLTLPQLQAGAVANQQGGYANALPGRILTHQPILGANYQGLATYAAAAAGSQSTPYIAAMPQSAQQTAQLIPGSAVLTQLTAPNTMTGKVSSQSPAVVPLSVQPTVHPAPASVPVSGANATGQSISMPATTTITATGQAKVSDPPSGSLNVSYYSQQAISDSSEAVLSIGDSNDSIACSSTQEAFYANSQNILSISNISPTEQNANTASPLLELITTWSSTVRQPRPASPMSIAQQDSEFYRYYKQLGTYHSTVEARAPKLWSPVNQLSLFMHIYDQIFANMPESAKQAWENHKLCALDSSTTGNNTSDDRNTSSSSPPSLVHSSFLPQSSSLPSSSKATDNVMELSTTQPLDEHRTAEPTTGMAPQPQGAKDAAAHLPTETFALAKQMFAAVPAVPSANPLQPGQDPLNLGFSDKQNFFSDLLAQFPATVNIADLTQVNPNFSALISNTNPNFGVGQRQKQDLGVQEATAQMLTHLNFVNGKADDIGNLLRACQPPLNYLKSPNELSLKTPFAVPNSSYTGPLPTVDCLFPPGKGLQMDAMLLLYLLSLGGFVEGVDGDNDHMSLLLSEAPSQTMKEYARKKCTEIRNKLLALYHQEDFFELKAGTLNLCSSGSVRATVTNYVAYAQNTNANLHLALQTNSDPGKEVLNLPCVLLDGEHLAFVLSRTKESSTNKDKEINRLLESVTFMNGKLTRREFYSKGQASQLASAMSSATLESGAGPNLKKHVHL